jgi:hypothetical protein
MQAATNEALSRLIPRYGFSSARWFNGPDGPQAGNLGILSSCYIGNIAPWLSTACQPSQIIIATIPQGDAVCNWDLQQMPMRFEKPRPPVSRSAWHTRVQAPSSLGTAGLREIYHAY